MFAIWVLNLIALCADLVVLVKSVRVSDARIEAPLFCVGSVLLILAIDFGFFVCGDDASRLRSPAFSPRGFYKLP